MQLNHLAEWMQVLRPHRTALGGALGAMAGAGVFYGISFDPAWVWGLFAIGFGLILYGAGQRVVGFGAAMAGICFVLAWVQVERAVSVDFAAASKPHWIVGTVEELAPSETPNRLIVRMKDVELYGLGQGAVERASISVYKSQASALEVRGGAAIQAVLMAGEGPKFEGQRDSRLWRYFQNGRIAGYAMGSVEETYIPPKQTSRIEGFLMRIEGIRQDIFRRTETLAGGAVAALLVGGGKGDIP